MTTNRRLLTAAIAGALLLTACGDDDTTTAEAPTTDVAVSTDEPAENEPVTTEEMTDEMTDDEPMTTDDEPATGATDVLLDELTAAGLDADHAQCVVDAAVAEWGEDALLAEGSATDAQLVRLGEITFDCAG